MFIILVLILCTFLYIHNRRGKLSLFSRNGIPCPNPSPIWGNILNMLKSQGTIDFQRQLITKYGPIVGYYLGTVPYLVVADKELLHEILVSNARLFITRPRRIPGGVNPDPKRKRMLAHLPPEEWKVVRKTLTGMFNPAKLKPQIQNLSRLVDIFMNSLEEVTNTNNSQEIELASRFQALSLDLIGQTAFGRRVQVQGNPNDPLLLAVQDKYQKHMFAPLNVLGLCFPELNWVVQPLRICWQNLKEITGFAGEKNSTLWEIAQKCLDDCLNPDINSNNSFSQFHLLQKAGIHPELMMAYCVNAFQGDYENVTTTLSFMTHLLIEHPEVQERILEEVAKVKQELEITQDNFHNDAEAAYEFYSRLKYMESVIYETLRLWPQTSFVRRSPSEDYKYVDSEGRKLTIPKGVHIQVAHYETQRERDVWGEDATKFNPQRFYKADGDRDKVSPNCVTYQGFGSGPRHCMGQKFAILILKMTVTQLLEKFRIEKSPKTGNLDDYCKSLMTPVQPFYAKLVKV